LKRGLEILYGVYFIIAFAAWIVPACAGVLFFKDHRAAGRYTSAAVKLLFFLAGIRVRVVGKEHMNTPGAKIYASNHTSVFDVLPLMGALGVPYRFVAKHEVHAMPFIGTFLRKMKHLSFERGDSNSRREAVQEMESTLREGESVFVFPEGTFVPEEGVRPFQLGAFHTAVSTGIPIVPVSLAGTRRFLRDGTILPCPTTVTITLSPPVTPSVAAANSSDWHQVVRLRDTVREQIARFSGEPLI